MKDRDLIGQRVTGRWTFLCSMAGDLEGEAVLDVACGAGWFEEYALSAGCPRVVGIERSAALAEAVSLRLPDAEIQVIDATGDLTSLGKFDTACAFDFVEHLPRGGEVRFLQGLHDLLQPGGRLLISVPYRSVLSCALDPAFFFGHRHYNLPQVERILSKSGFKVDKAVFAGGLWEQVSMIWLYLFKWLFRREMPFADFLEERRRREYESWGIRPGPGSFVTMFIEARPGQATYDSCSGGG
jgi:SAM-dependent methyltransferase